MAEDLEQRVREIQREYLDFLDDEQTGDGTYTQLVNDLIKNNEKRLIVNINHLRKRNPKRASSLINNAPEEILAFERALREFIGSADPTYAKEHEEFFVGFTGSFGNHHVTPRTLSAKHLSHIICVEGIVTKCSLVRPKVVKSVHYCPTTRKTIERKYADLTSYDAFPTSSVYPTKDEDGNLLETEYGLCTYKDHQTLSVQEMPEKSPAGQLPRSVDVVCDNDLVDQCKPGDRLHIVGVYRCLPGKQGGFTSGTFRTILIANSISPISKEQAPNISTSDVKKCKKFAHQRIEDKDVFDILAQSLAPSICGHLYIKKALLCMLLGGVEKHLPNGTRLRGDINILLIGDPSVAKSQLLRYVLHTAPRALSTTGRGSSGVGLTAAVTTDQETGERRLEAGAMVLADRGVVCIDEFDKMSDQDRTAIHEVMEQGRVTISKAGIHARLNARCSVLAAANPVYGNYNQYKTPMENIGLQDSLLSRFDLLFIMLDTVDSEQDRLIADHVVRMHRFRSSNEQEGEALANGGLDTDLLTTIREQDDADKESEEAIYEKYDPLLHGNLRSKKDKIVSMNFMKKYIHIAKFIKPTLTQEASDLISEEYSKLRTQEQTQSDLARTQPITARALETLIRLSTAHAKARLSKTVDVSDAEAAIELVQYAYFKKVMEKPKRHKRKADEEDDLSQVDDKAAKKSKVRVRKLRKQPGEEGFDPYDWVEDEEEEDTESLPLSTPSSTPMDTSSSAEVTDERFKVFKSSLFKMFKEARAESIAMEKIKKSLNEEHSSQQFSTDEITASLQRMTDANQVMLADNILFLI